MLKKTISYTDFNGTPRTEDFYFNLSKAEIAEWELRENLSGGLEAVLQRVISSNDGRQIMDTFRDVIAKSYGIKSPDGRSFLKSPEISAGFLGSEAYSELFMELIMDPSASAAFIRAIVPADFNQQAQTGPRQPQDHRPAQPKTQQVQPELPTAAPVLEPQAAQQARPMTYEEYMAQQGVRPQTQPESHISRPPHETGPGYEQSAQPYDPQNDQR